MKPYLFILFALTIISCSENNNKKQEENKNLLSTDIVNNPNSAQGVDSVALGELPTMDFTDTVYDFGNIKAGEVVVHEFEFKNNGKSPLIIGSTAVACGCTVPDYPHEPIPPGKTEKLIVKFNSEGKSGHQDKSVSIETNTHRGTHYIYIKADVSK